jgi:hypothetical protein
MLITGQPDVRLGGVTTDVLLFGNAADVASSNAVLL